MNKKKRVLFLTWLVPALLCLLPGESGAHVDLNPFNLSHNSPSHLVSTVGLDACIQAVNTIRGIDSKLADSIGLTAQGCRDAANSMSRTAKEAEQVVQDTVEDAIDCASDPVGCAEKIAADLGVDDPNLGKMAILTGNVTFKTGGLLFSDFGVTNLNIDADDSRVSAACKAFIAAFPWPRGGALTLTTGGSYRLVVPACGAIIYTLKPTNPLFTWNPPTRTVTVGAGGGSSTSGGSGSSISTGNMQQMETTGEGGAQIMMRQQMIKQQNDQRDQQQESGSSGGSGKSGGQPYYRSRGKGGK